MTDEETDSGVMTTLVQSYPALMTPEEIRRELHEKRRRITDSLHRLESTGLIHRTGAFVFATRAAYHAGKLDYC